MMVIETQVDVDARAAKLAAELVEEHSMSSELAQDLAASLVSERLTWAERWTILYRNTPKLGPYSCTLLLRKHGLLRTFGVATRRRTPNG